MNDGESTHREDGGREPARACPGGPAPSVDNEVELMTQRTARIMFLAALYIKLNNLENEKIDRLMRELGIP